MPGPSSERSRPRRMPKTTPKTNLMSKDAGREAVYGMPYETWKSTYQGAASPEQVAAMKKAHSGH